MRLTLRRKIVNYVMLSLTGICTLFAVGMLLFILGYLFINGGRSLTWDFFTQLPKPVGETGGGMANALLGSAKLLLVATCIGVPIGFLAGVYLAEFGGSKFSFVVRYTNRLGSFVIDTVVPGTLNAGAEKTSTVTFHVPKTACTGQYTLTLEAYVEGVLIGTDTADLLVTP